MTTQLDLENNFWQIVQEELSRHNFGIANGCEQEVRKFIKVGAKQIIDEDAPPDRIEIAEWELRAFVQTMVVKAVVEGMQETHENNFGEVHNDFCPRWPFC